MTCCAFMRAVGFVTVSRKVAALSQSEIFTQLLSSPWALPLGRAVSKISVCVQLLTSSLAIK